tara:strand:+ start:428 stop:682 length:255 start_codon:yes stop_codon:yes gene_type:complete
MLHIDAAMNNSTTTATLRNQASSLISDIEEYKFGSDSAGWKFGFDVSEAEQKLQATQDEIALHEEALERDRMDQLDMIAAANGR